MPCHSFATFIIVRLFILFFVFSVPFAFSQVSTFDPDPKDEGSIEWIDGQDSRLDLQGFEWIKFDSLYRRIPADPVWEVSKSVDNLANNTLFSVSDTKSHIEAYSISLEEIKPLIEANSGDAVVNVISLLLKETETVHLHAKTLESKLEQATKDIKSLQREHLAFKE